MGKRIDAQKTKNCSYANALQVFSEIALYRFLRPWTHNDWIFFNFLNRGRELKRSLDIMHDFTQKVVKERKDTLNCSSDKETNRLSFLDMLIKLETEGKIPNNEVKEEVDTFMFEDSNTDIQQEIREELSHILGPEKSAWPTMSQLAEMKLLERCVKESQRLYPPVPFVERRLDVPLELDDEWTIPAGVTVSINFDQLHKDAEYFPDPYKWNPDRFLPENMAQRHPFAFCPFSAGLRNCIGQKFAMMEEKAILCHLIRNFKFESIQQPNEMDPTYQLVLRPVNGVILKFYPIY